MKFRKFIPRRLKHEAAQLIIGATPAFRGRTVRAPVNYIDSRTAISLEYQFIYGRIPKAANSTVVATLANASGFIIPDDGIPDHKGSFSRPHQFGKRELASILSNFFKFTVVRNPYDRIISCYLDKIHGGKPQREIVLRKLAKRSSDVTFEDFVNYLSGEESYRDPHWVPQCKLLFIDPKELDFIGKVESLEHDMGLITETIFGHPSPPRNWAFHSTDAAMKRTQFLSSDMKNQIYKLYEEDFDTFRYRKNAQ